LTRGDCPGAYDAVQGNHPATLLIRGGSGIIDPLGGVLVEPNFAGESIRVAGPPYHRTRKYDLDVVGHYARRDIFGLTVDTTPKNAVSFHGPRKNEAGDKATLNGDAKLVERERGCLD
jgi:nitrilase